MLGHISIILELLKLLFLCFTALSYVRQINWPHVLHISNQNQIKRKQDLKGNEKISLIDFTVDN